MELTSEEKQRIEDEERRRVSEEQYRAEVRARLHTEAVPIGSKRTQRATWLAGIAVILAIGALIAWSITKGTAARPNRDAAASNQLENPTPAPVLKTRYLPVAQNIAKGQITVSARGFAQYQFTITPDMLQPVFAGDFAVSGGGGNDIMAVIADEDSYSNWINGHQARVYWTTQGRETTGQFKVRLPPGTYYLAFSNKFSLFSPKQITVTAYINYQKAETYYDDPSAPVRCPVPPCTGNSLGANPAAPSN